MLTIGAETPEIQLLVAEGGVRLTVITSGSRDPQADMYGVSVNPEHRIEPAAFSYCVIPPVYHFPLRPLSFGSLLIPVSLHRSLLPPRPYDTPRMTGRGTCTSNL